MKERENEKPERDHSAQSRRESEPARSTCVPGPTGACDQPSVPMPPSLADTAEYIPPPPSPAAAKVRNQSPGITL